MLVKIASATELHQQIEVIILNEGWIELRNVGVVQITLNFDLSNTLQKLLAVCAKSSLGNLLHCEQVACFIVSLFLNMYLTMQTCPNLPFPRSATRSKSARWALEKKGLIFSWINWRVLDPSVDMVSFREWWSDTDLKLPFLLLSSISSTWVWAASVLVSNCLLLFLLSFKPYRAFLIFLYFSLLLT